MSDINLNKDFINEFFRFHNSNPSKKLGQNFLIDNKIIEKIVDSIKFYNDSKVLEIGPGLGALTNKLVNKNINLTCVEYDYRFYEYLLKVYENKIDIKNVDFLKYNEIEFDFVLGNLPYSITTGIIEKILLNFINVKECVFMVQEEFYDRVLNPYKKETSPLSILLEYRMNTKKITKVNKNSFYPTPNVDSVVFKLTNKNIDFLFSINLYKTLRIIFNNKRKTIFNNLKLAKVNNEDSLKIEEEAGFMFKKRAQELKLNEFILLTNLLIKYKVI